MSSNVYSQAYSVNRESRNHLNHHRSMVLWFTGLSGSGKSTIANRLQEELFQEKQHVYVLDGDNVRLGINNDLDFTEAGRKENIRRVAEVAKLMVDAGLIVITGFISPFIADREMARKIIGDQDFLEIFIDAPIEVCEKRDVKGLYARARKGEIPNFTGISSAYEPPVSPFITVKTGDHTMEECLMQIQSAIQERLKL
jgi:adenylyl-sulfate kinase